MAAPEAWHAGRTMRVLELLAFAPLSAPQLAAALHAQPRTVRRVLARLAEDGYVTYSAGGRRVYAPTMRLVALAGQVVENSPLARSSQPFVGLLHHRAQATAHLMVPSYQSTLCLVHVEADGGGERPGLRELVPAHCTAAGNALLAWRDRWRESVLAVPLERFTDRTVTEAAALRRALEDVRRRGYAVEDGEYRAGLCAAAAPVRVFGEVVAALSVSSARRRLDAAIPAVVETAGELAEHLEHNHR